MKKIIPIIVIIVALIAGGVFFFLQKGKGLGGKAVMTDLLPAGPVFFFDAIDMGKNLDTFIATALWQKLRAINVEGTLKKMGANEQEIANYKNFDTMLRAPETQKFFKQFFGLELAVAMYSDGDVSSGVANPLQFGENIFFITRLDPKAQATEFFTSLFLPLGKKTSMQTVEYNKHKVQIVATEDGAIKIGYVRIKDVLVFGLGEKAARRGIDMLDGKQKTLSQDGAYAMVKAKFLPGSEFLSYVDFESILTLIKGLAMQFVGLQQGVDAEAARQQLEDSFGQVKGFQSVGYSSTFDKLTKVKFDLYFDKNALHEDIRPIYDCPPVENKSIALVPQNVLAYQWSTCYDLNYYWKQMQKDMQRSMGPNASEEAIKDAIKKLEENLKLSITDDILPAFGQQIGGYLQDIKITDQFPIPGILLFIEAKNKEKAEKVVGTLIAQQPAMQVQEEKYSDQMIKYLNIPNVSDLSPAYAIVGDYLLIATNRQLIKDSMDTAQDPNKSVTANPNFQELNFDLTQKNNSVLFVQMDSLMDKGQAIADWGNKWVAAQVAQQEAFKSGSEKRLTDTQAALEMEQSELKGLREKAKALSEKTTQSPPSENPSPTLSPTPDPAQPTDSSTASAATAAEALDLVKQIEEKEKSIQGKEESIKQLEQMVTAMKQSPSPDPQTRQALVDDLLKPLLRAFSSLKTVTSRAVFGEGILETFSYMKIE